MSGSIGPLDNVVHQRVRLGILTVLTEAARADFAFLRDTLELTDGNLSSNLQILEQAGYVSIEKTFEGRKPRTWVRSTAAGRRALEAEVAILESIVSRVNGARSRVQEAEPGEEATV